MEEASSYLHQPEMMVLTHPQNHIGDGTRLYPRVVDSSVGDGTMAGNTKKKKKKVMDLHGQGHPPSVAKRGLLKVLEQ